MTKGRIKQLENQQRNTFVALPGEWCLEDCKKRGKMFPVIEVGKAPKRDYNDEGYPWCFEYGTEITDRDEKTGRYRKCMDCLGDKTPSVL